MARTFAIVGAGQAGGWIAKTLRDQGFDGRIVLYGEEPYPPHERPPLSKDLLLGKIPVEKTYLWPDATNTVLNIESKRGVRVTRIRPAEHTIESSDGDTLKYDRLALATGARVRKLNIPGADLARVFYLRTIDDTLAIRKELTNGAHVLVIGGGWIGLECAAAARLLGARATVLEALGQLCNRALPADLAGYVLKRHRDADVDVRLNTTVQRLEGDGQVQRAVLSDGATLDVDLVVIGIGVVPNVELAADAGLKTDNGIVVDELTRTSDPDIFAAGDCTNHPTALGRRIRLESWENAQNQGIACAKAMLDKGAPYHEIPWFWSDQGDMNLQLVGLPALDATGVRRGDEASGQFIVFYMKDGKIDGAAAVNNGRDVRIVRRLMQAGKIVDPAKLADPAVKLQDLLKG